MSVADDGYLEGKLNDEQGWFPNDHVQDINIISKFSLIEEEEKRKELFSSMNDSFLENNDLNNDEKIIISRDALSALMMNNDQMIPRTIVLQRGKKGFGFVLRGSRGNAKTNRFQ